LTVWSVNARNTARASRNKMHDDAVARQYGFAGGLVPGVDVYAYLTFGPVAAWGVDFLERGHMAARFLHPVYDGDTLTVTFDGHDLELRDSRDLVCATGHAVLPADAVDEPDAIPAGPLPADPPPASAAAFRDHPALGSIECGFHAAHAGEYLTAVGETLDLYTTEGVAHPGWLLRMANDVLATNVRLGPWIHTSSTVQHHSVVRDGDRVSTRARVVDVFERKGHRFVSLEVAIVANDERLALWVEHTAIYEPRRDARLST
jgi:acyl dehydratase